MTDTPQPLSASRPPLPLLTPGRRFGRMLVAWACLLGASPGIAGARGSLFLALCGVALWGATCARDLGAHRWRARLAEWLPAALGGGGLMAWIWYVTPFGVLWIGAGWGIYALLGGALVRSTASRHGLLLAIPAGWVFAEELRNLVPPPFGLGWLRLGHYAHHHLWFSGSARVWGVLGLGLALAVVAAAIAVVARERRVRARVLVAGLAALLIPTVVARVVAAPAMVEGPRVMLVQPAFEQERKQFDDPSENFAASVRLTLEGLAAEDEPVDLVSWGESMLYVPLLEGVEEALRAGAQTPPWSESFDQDLVRRLQDLERSWVHGRLLDALPSGTAFVSGAEVFKPWSGRDPTSIRRFNAVVLYDGDGSRGPSAAKQELVPGAETMLGFEHIQAARDFALRLTGYVPDFVRAERTGLLSFVTRAGRPVYVGASVCFDNAFEGPFVEPLSRPLGPAPDFHLVVSNEAWYRTSFEMDQMIAFSRMAALMTGRSVVRAANSGISAVLGADGTELGRIRQGERDRAVRGTLTLAIPVPGDPRARTPYTHQGVRTLLRWSILLLLLAFSRIGSKGRAANGNPGPVSG